MLNRFAYINILLTTHIKNLIFSWLAEEKQDVVCLCVP